MKIELLHYDDEITLVTSHGTAIHVSVTECKTELGIAGHTDQIRIHTRQPISVTHYPKNPDDAALHGITVGEDHFPACMRKVEPDWQPEDDDDDDTPLAYETPVPARWGQDDWRKVSPREALEKVTEETQ